MKFKILAITVACILLTTANKTDAQVSKYYKKNLEKFYYSIDSLNKLNPVLIVSNEAKQMLKKLDKKQPYEFFAEATYTYEASNDKFDYAFIIYQVGLIRYKYFLAVNPDYPPSDGWMVAESMQAVYNDRMTLHLKTNIDKYIAVLKFAIDYCNNNNYDYWTKPKDVVLHKKIIEYFSALLNNYTASKEKYVKDWQEEREQKLLKEKELKDPTKRYAGIDTTVRNHPLNKIKPLEFESIKTSKEVLNYFNFTRMIYRSRFINAKTNYDIQTKIDHLKITENQKLELFKIFYVQDDPETEDMTQPEYDRYIERCIKFSEEKEAKEKAVKEKVKLILGNNLGGNFWDEIQGLVSYNRESLEKL